MQAWRLAMVVRVETFDVVCYDSATVESVDEEFLLA
jgi:hypothetical protein